MSKRYLIALLAIIAMLGAACGEDTDGAAAPDDNGDGDGDGEEPAEISGDITMARANWDTGYFQAEIYYQLLTELGYTVGHPESNELGAELFYVALDGRDVDFWANGWFPLHDNFFAETDNTEKVGIQIEAGASQGYLIDKASADEHGIESIEQIADDPELVELFDSDGDGMADLTGCNAGWGCHESIEQHFEEQGLNETIEHEVAEYSVLMADTIARYERGEPIFFYTWTPNWTVGILEPGEDVVWIEAPTHPDGQEPVAGFPGCVNDPCDIGWAANDIVVVANSEFLEEHPPAATLLGEIELSVSEVAAQNVLMDGGEDTREDIAGHAQDWIEENRDTVDEWLEAARAAAE